MFADRTKWNLASNRLSAALAAHRARGQAAIDLTGSNPTDAGFVYDGEAILEALGHPDALKYEPDPRGLQVARRAVAQYYSHRVPEIPIDNILLTTSTSEAYSFIFRTLCNPGDEILVPAPSYPLFDFLADIQDVRLLPYPLFYDHGWHIDFHVLKQTVTARSRGVIVVHPNNPTGHFTKARELRELNVICATRDMALIADEVFLDFGLGESRSATFAANRDVLTFTLSGLSKSCGLPQMKMAWIVASGPEPLKAEAMARLDVIADTYLSMNAPVQLATPAFLQQRQSFQGQLMARVRVNLAELDRQLAAQPSCSRLVMEGGWYAVLRIPATRSDEDFAIELLAAQSVYIHPGHFYNFPAEGHLVASLITRPQEFAEGIRRLLRLF
ncbi:MAG: pyridoxal phosphate-dependent aminotransferase [Candidatus Acidiferrales bacterium]|jgi:aspartate/methionine/tyrosine aminotransferase